ncbi:MAG TPA: HD domain-containing phosphohydrolase [Fimbriimonadaceae bacterium]|nr:HD domain-containing phosphohydrolase [Fimbriimonadaceae bacterium]
MISEWQAKARILIVDDNSENLLLLGELLRFSGYRKVQSETDSSKILELILSWRPDLIILDLHMPNVSGFDILELIRCTLPEDNFLPVLVFTADWTETTRKRALDLGAWDFITKPFNASELLLRVRNFLRMRQMHVQLERQKTSLESTVERRTRHVLRARAEALECLARAGEYRDDVTGEHTRRVADMSAQIAEELGMAAATVEIIRISAPLHDLGKIGISDSLLLKPGKLTPEEIDIMRKHAEVGALIIGNAKSPQLRKAREIALYHHENWDGSGYPFGISRNKIPISARIVAVADTFDALINERPYKRAWPIQEAITEVQRQSGARFDPAIVEAFLRVCRKSFAIIRVEEGSAESAETRLSHPSGFAEPISC